MTTRDQLLKLMDEHRLNDAKVAVMLDVSAYTVQSWVRGQRTMRPHMLELLQYKLDAQQQTGG